MDIVKILICFGLLIFGVYLSSRVIFHAYFISKKDFIFKLKGMVNK